jgi:hypothetical protein
MGTFASVASRNTDTFSGNGVSLFGGIQMGSFRVRHVTAAAALIEAAALASALAYQASETGHAKQGGNGKPATATAITAGSLTPPELPGCAWPVETAPATGNVAAPDPFATNWLTPFPAAPGQSVTIRGVFPTSRFMSFAVYNDSFQLFTNKVHGKNVPSDLSDYQITPDQGTTNPWRTGQVRKGQRFTIRLLPVATVAQRRSENAIPMIDQHPPVTPSGPAGVSYVVFRAYLAADGSAAMRLPTITVTRGGRSTTLPQCRPGARPQTSSRPASIADLASTAVLDGLRDDGVAMSCATRCAARELQYFAPSADSRAGLLPNPVNGYLEMGFTPKPGYVVVTHGLAPTSPARADHGAPGDSSGALPVSWVNPAFQVRYWSIANYLDTQPYPVVEVGQGSAALVGATPDYLTTLKGGYYTVVSSLPSDKPSAASLKAHGATWIPMSASHAKMPEFQLLRNVLPQQSSYPEGFAFISPPANPSKIIGPAAVRRQMGAYYPRTAQCTVAAFEAGGWAGCLAATHA